MSAKSKIGLWVSATRTPTGFQIPLDDLIEYIESKSAIDTVVATQGFRALPSIVNDDGTVWCSYDREEVGDGGEGREGKVDLVEVIRDVLCRESLGASELSEEKCRNARCVSRNMLQSVARRLPTTVLTESGAVDLPRVPPPERRVAIASPGKRTLEVYSRALRLGDTSRHGVVGTPDEMASDIVVGDTVIAENEAMQYAYVVEMLGQAEIWPSEDAPCDKGDQ